ncbi:phosphodiesterase [Ramlibacter rhizophilus]|uniref:Phosphodiesterase n=1 Tax=Ramlibacter rhizophilus TaxID=1781167 RepID=A0A4Z0BGJ5_9BURK|nr:phosphodiesterase [Ramlibacter rhizophilus]TFY98435.1 phosphodiesterase [Ramlibacter rhizophilus]
MLVQLTDLHICEPGQLACGRIDTAAFLRTAVASVLRLRQRPRAVVITGDLVESGRAAEYAHLAELLAPLDLPLYLLPGNHDERGQLRRSFPGHAWLHEGGEFIQYAVDVGGLRLIALDTSEPGASHGRLDAPRLTWLERQLQACRDRPVVIAMHHPPFTTLIGHMDDIGLLQGAGELEALVARHANVERVICGHLHRAIDVRFGGTIACTTPSPAHQITLDLDPRAPAQWMFEPPGLRVLAQDGRGRVVSHVAASGEFEGPYPF